MPEDQLNPAQGSADMSDSHQCIFARSLRTTRSMRMRNTAVAIGMKGARRISTSIGYMRGVRLDMVEDMRMLDPKSGVLMW